MNSQQQCSANFALSYHDVVQPPSYSQHLSWETLNRKRWTDFQLIRNIIFSGSFLHFKIFIFVHNFFIFSATGTYLNIFILKFLMKTTWIIHLAFYFNVLVLSLSYSITEPRSQHVFKSLSDGLRWTLNPHEIRCEWNIKCGSWCFIIPTSYR